MRYLTKFIILSFLFCNNSLSLIDELYDITWKKYDEYEDKRVVFVGKSKDEKNEYIKIQQYVNFEKEILFSTIKNLDSYDQIISNKNVKTKLIHVEKDTLYGYQLISNMIPFIRNRNYIFKMYEVNENRLDWLLLDRNNILLSNYKGENNNTLNYGAGSWQIKEDSLIVFRMYVDDEVNMPNAIINKIRINSIINTFNDVIKKTQKEKK